MALCSLLVQYVLFQTDDNGFGVQSPPLTKLISDTLRRYPEGGQILKVSGQCLLDNFVTVYTPTLYLQSTRMHRKNRCVIF